MNKPLSASKVQVRIKRMPRHERLSLNSSELARYRELQSPDNTQGRPVMPAASRREYDQEAPGFSWQATHYQRGLK